MPRNRNNPEPPRVMTWPKASWVLVIAAVLDALRYVFLFFWFFGPALAGLYCTAKVGDVALVGGLLAKGCVAGAAVLGAGGFAITAAFGSIMAIAVGFLGWLIVTFIIFATDRRTFGENPATILWLLAGFGASVFVMAWGVYRKQIKVEKVAYANWEKEKAARQLQERNQQAANNERYNQEQAANDAQYTQTLDKAA